MRGVATSETRRQGDRVAGVEIGHFGSANIDRAIHYDLSLKRWILPVAVLGSSDTYSTPRGYL